MSAPLPGKYNAKVCDYSFRKSQAGEPMIVIRFKFDSDKEWNWTGSLGSDKAKERTLKTLLTIGLNTDDLETLIDGPASNSLDMDTEVEIVLDKSVYEGKERLQIAFVNPIGGFAFGDAMSKDELKVKLGGMNIKGELQSLRKSLNKPIKHADIPF